MYFWKGTKCRYNTIISINLKYLVLKVENICLTSPIMKSSIFHFCSSLYVWPLRLVGDCWCAVSLNLFANLSCFTSSPSACKVLARVWCIHCRSGIVICTYCKSFCTWYHVCRIQFESTISNSCCMFGPFSHHGKFFYTC